MRRRARALQLANSPPSPAQAIVSKTETLSTPLEIPPWSAADVYANVCAVPLFLFMIPVWALWSAMVYPLCALGSFYIHNVVTRPQDRFDGPGFYLLVVLTYP